LSIMFWLNHFVNYILTLLSEHIDRGKFKKYLLALLLEDKYFSVRRYSRTTQEYSLDQFYDFLKTKINWQKIFCRLAKIVIFMFRAIGFYLVADATPLKQVYAGYRIAKHGHVCIKSRKKHTPK